MTGRSKGMSRVLLFAIIMLLATLGSIVDPIGTAQAAYQGVNGKILFMDSRDGPDGDIFHMNADGTNQTQLTANSFEDTTPTWSPDGTRIVFASNRDGNFEIYVMNADGSGQTRLTNNASSDRSPHFSPDGTRIAFSSDRDGNREIYMMNADGSGQTRLTNNMGVDDEPFWSPDGTQLVFHGERGSDLEIFVIHADGTAETQLTTNDGTNDVQPDWAPDGTKIVFASGPAVANGGLEIWVMNANGSGQTQLTSDLPVVDYTPSFSPDGTKITFASNRNGDADIYVMNTDGTDLTQITFDPATTVLPDWQVLPKGGPDADNDGIIDDDDNCLHTPNPDQNDICSLQDGDYLVGVGEASPSGFGEQKGKIVRIRGGVQTDFCESQSWNPHVPPFFNVPSEVLIDLEGRVVFLAYLGGNFDNASQAGWGLWRCDAMGELPTLIAAFGSNPAFNYPSPVPGRPVRHVGGLHVKRSVGVNLNNGTAAEHGLYVFAIGDNCCGGQDHDTLGYEPATGHFTTYTLDPPAPGSNTQMDMIYMSGPSGLFGFPASYTVSVSEGRLRAVLEPIRLDFQAGDFFGGLAFQRLTDLQGLAVDDITQPNTPICPGGPGHTDIFPKEIALNQSGSTVDVMGSFSLLAAGDGLVIQANSGHPFLSRVDFAHMDLDFSNDIGAYHHNLACGHGKTLRYTPWHPFNGWWDEKGVFRLVKQMDPGGTVGTHPNEGRIVRVGPTTGDVTILADGLNLPTGIDVYPGFRPPLGGVAIFIKIESPVDVLITGPDGRRIGVDPNNGLPVNEYAEAGYDSQTSEPHIYGIYGPGPGIYTIAIKGTGNGPYTVTTYGVDVGTLQVTQSSITGTASPGNQEQAVFSVDNEGHLGDTTPPTLACPPNQTVPATSASGAVVNYPAADATDAVDPAPTITYSQNSETTFPIGTTTVDVTATDASGNSSTCSFTVTVTVGTPKLSGKILGKGRDASGVYFVDLQLKDIGTGHARNIRITQMPLKTLTGSGAVSYNTTLSPALPLTMGNLDVGGATTVRLYLNVPTTVTKFSITEQGTLQDVAGTTFNYSIGQAVIP